MKGILNSEDTAISTYSLTALAIVGRDCYTTENANNINM